MSNSREASPTRVLIVDDDAAMREFLRRNLAARAFDVSQAANGREALTLLRQEVPELVLLDIMMPELDGFETCSRLREFTDVPVIVLTAMGDERDIVRALDSGADDCLTKPFGVEELLARVRSVLRRSPRPSPGSDEAPDGRGVHDDRDDPNGRDDHEGRDVLDRCGVVQYRDLTVDLGAYRAWIRGAEMSLTRTEFDVLAAYATQLNKTVPHRKVLAMVWGPGYDTETHYVRIYVSRLRAKIECPDESPYFTTEHGLGYRLGA